MNQPVMAVPVVVELDPVPDVVLSLEAVSDLPDVVLLESRIDREEVSRFSFLVADPVEFVTCESADQGVDPFGRLRELLEESETGRIAGLPPFQGGVVGMLGYELSEAWETTPRSVHDEFSLPALAAGLYDRVIAWDHVLDRAWVISQGFPESDPQRRWQRATQRATSGNRVENPLAIPHCARSWEFETPFNNSFGKNKTRDQHCFVADRFSSLGYTLFVHLFNCVGGTYRKI